MCMSMHVEALFDKRDCLKADEHCQKQQNMHASV